MSDDFHAFIQKRKEVARAYVNGDAAPLERIAAVDFPASFFHPKGAVVEGAERVLARYTDDATAFCPGGESDIEIIQMGHDTKVGYWVGYQNASVRLKGVPDPVQMRLRVTEIFRRTNGQWQLVHRHADMPQAR
ncbi:ketosteroid isomerase-like protein [Rhizobium azooxidifex]|uniref:Ketosteroid isomerase-like protein n=1 Tax=Mycoplana azooxidifex TaxID=1636188 RepID=A0A7W6D606_9HYPH|nr:nuclear transport factor 2 family protein [Mycoplana azooxidifex]MBB3976702.1 ketosteroid isomerase-like protein [Mycoplana azooxidifex]